MHCSRLGDSVKDRIAKARDSMNCANHKRASRDIYWWTLISKPSARRSGVPAGSLPKNGLLGGFRDRGVTTLERQAGIQAREQLLALTTAELKPNQVFPYAGGHSLSVSVLERSRKAKAKGHQTKLQYKHGLQP
jgi:hypothetical protein